MGIQIYSKGLLLGADLLDVEFKFLALCNII